MDYDLLKIKSYKYWAVYLNENQCYLGRAFILLKEDEGVEYFFDRELISRLFQQRRYVHFLKRVNL